MSNIVVQKFGGTSLADTDRFKAVAKIIKDTSKKGKKVVAVVSAMAGETQRLIDLAQEVQEIPDPREYDALISSGEQVSVCLLYTSPSPRDSLSSRMPSSACKATAKATAEVSEPPLPKVVMSPSSLIP